MGLWERKHMVSFLKIDKGLAHERDGVRLPESMPDLEELLDGAVESGVTGAKVRAFIMKAEVAGIRAAVDWLLGLSDRISAKGLVPIVHLEVDIDSPEKAACERILRQRLEAELRKLSLKPKGGIMLELTMPDKSNFYKHLLEHPSLIRLVYSFGGRPQDDALQLLEVNQGVAGFGQAFMEGMRANQTVKEFGQHLTVLCRRTYEASRAPSQAFDDYQESSRMLGG